LNKLANSCVTKKQVPSPYLPALRAGWRAALRYPDPPGELSEWVDNADPADSSQNWTEKYALITMLAALGTGNWVMSIAGSGSEHPWAMADYFTIPEHATDLVRHLRLPSGRLPAAYQVVIRAGFKSQTPVKVTYVAHRSLDTP
jgi:hypothetical protein